MENKQKYRNSFFFLAGPSLLYEYLWQNITLAKTVARLQYILAKMVLLFGSIDKAVE